MDGLGGSLLRSDRGPLLLVYLRAHATLAALARVRQRKRGAIENGALMSLDQKRGRLQIALARLCEREAPHTDSRLGCSTSTYINRAEINVCGAF